MKALDQIIETWCLKAHGLEENAKLLRSNGMLESARGQRIRAETIRQLVSELQHEQETAGRAA